MSANGTDDDLAALVDGAAALGSNLDEAQVAAFARYRELLLDWNTRTNLTAITDPVDVLTRHFLDSFTCLLAIPPQRRQQALLLLDVGSGAGFPGLPLAIAYPRWQVVLLEATGKKVRFLEAVIGSLGLINVQATNGRAEYLAHQPQHRRRYDIVTARAVAALPTLLEYCAPFAHRGGFILMPKKGDLVEELAAGERAAVPLGASSLTTLPVTVPPLDDGRVIVVAQQEHPCPAQYPRPAGAPVKRPLG